MRTFFGILAATLLTAPVLAAKPAVRPRAKLLPATIVHARRLSGVATARSLAPGRNTASGPGISQNLGVVGRLVGNGGVLYRTSVDVQNNTSSSTPVDFFFDGMSGSTVISVEGMIQNDSSGFVAAYSNAHYDDFIDMLAQNGLISPSEEVAGVFGSMLIAFDDLSSQHSGEGVASARFYSTVGSDGGSLSGGTIGVAGRSQEITTNNPLQLVGIFRDTIGEAGTPQLYANLFLNNMAFDNSGFSVTDTDTVQLTAYSSSTGQVTGNPYSVTIGPGLTVVIPNVLGTLGIPGSEDTILVFAVVTSGNAAIDGVAVEVDNTTKDGSAIYLHAAEFY